MCIRIRVSIQIITCFLVLTLLGCSNLNLYDTEIYGEYTISFATQNRETEIRLNLITDNTFLYTSTEITSETEAIKHICSGSFSERIINNDIIEIEYILENETGQKSGIDLIGFDTDRFRYKYKNMLGIYRQMDTAKIGNFSDFTVRLDTTDLCFSKDGFCESLGERNPYIVREHIIWVNYGTGFYPLYHIVDGGIFSPILSKST